MPVADLHIHTNYSCDCSFDMAEMCRSAMQMGLSEIGFSEHYDLLPEDPCYGFFRAEAWWESLERCRAQFADQLTIRAGVELGEPHRYPQQIEQLLNRFPWDYALGSLHWVGAELIFDKAYFRRSRDAAFREYFLELQRMAAQGGFDILAHMDVVKRYGFDIYGSYDPLSYEQEIRAVLSTCVQQGIALELNTSTLRRSVLQISPVRPVLDWYRQEGGKLVTFGSDAHYPEHIGFGLTEVSAALHAAGFEQATTFKLRAPHTLPVPSQP